MLFSLMGELPDTPKKEFVSRMSDAFQLSVFR